MDDPALIGIGASAGGIEALLALVAGLDPATPATVLVVLHQAEDGPSVLAGILARRCPLEVAPAVDGAPLEPGHVLVAPAGTHLQVHDRHVVLGRGPKENGHRPGVDPLFRSLALAAGPRATGVVLSGLLDDGAAGLLDIVRHGGAAVVQDPDEAVQASMPEAALEQVPGAVVRRAADIGAVLSGLAERELPGGHRPSDRLVYEVGVGMGRPRELAADPGGPAAGLSCPDCAGPLFDLGTEDRPRFRCRVGHAWSPHSLAREQDDGVENALYAALRALEDKAALSRRIAASAEESGAGRVSARSRGSATDALRAASVLRGLLTGEPDDDEPRHDEPEHGDGSGTT